MTLVVLAFALPTLAAEAGSAPTADDAMANWKPRQVTSATQDKKEIGALWKSMEAAQKKGDVDAAADLVDYPVLMVTDNSKNDGMGETWTREKWIQVMQPFYKHPHPGNVTHKANIFLMSDSLASVDDTFTMKMGGKTVSGRSSSILIKKNGKWLVKAMAEPGWGDMPMPATASQPSMGNGSAASQGRPPSGSEGGTGSGSSGASTGAQDTGSSQTPGPATK